MLCRSMNGPHGVYAFFLAAQRRFAPAIIRARASGLMTLLGAADFDDFAADVLAGADFDAVGAGAPFRRAAQRAFMDAANLARPSGVSPPFFLGAAAAFAAGAGEVPFTFAQRARAAAAIFSRASGDILPRPFPVVGWAAALVAATGEAPPNTAANSACSFSICCEISRARLSWSMDGVFVDMGLGLSGKPLMRQR